MAPLITAYVNRYQSPQGPDDSRPAALDIVADNDLLNNAWAGRVALVTGGTAGIGVETVRALHATGADVYFTARDKEKGRKTHEEITASTKGRGKLVVLDMDNDSLESVRAAAKSFLAQSKTLNVLINNGGIMACPESKTKDGFERQLGVNHLAHYLLTTLLLPTLIASSHAEAGSRIVNVSSSSHRFSTVVWDDINLAQPGAYDPQRAYGQSKTANVWTANYIDRVYGRGRRARGVNAHSLHPGGIWSGLQVHMDPELRRGYEANPDVRRIMLSPAQGAATSVWAAVARAWEGKGGEYLSECSIVPLAAAMDTPVDIGAAPHVHDVQSEDRLWAVSAELVGLTAEELRVLEELARD